MLARVGPPPWLPTPKKIITSSRSWSSAPSDLSAWPPTSPDELLYSNGIRYARTREPSADSHQKAVPVRLDSCGPGRMKQ
jgi:hypothetical protein